MARQTNSELAVLICSVGKEKVSLYCNSQLGAFLNHQMLFQCSADIFDFLSLIFVWLTLRWGLGALEKLREVKPHCSFSQHLRGPRPATRGPLSAARAQSGAHELFSLQAPRVCKLVIGQTYQRVQVSHRLETGSPKRCEDPREVIL